MALDNTFGGQPWWVALYPSWNPLKFQFQMNPVGMGLTRAALWVLELIRLVPAGTYKVQVMLQQGGWGCAHGGHCGAFTPMWLMVGRKPLN
jgi:sterol 24-C-methyltransferase